MSQSSTDLGLSTLLRCGGLWRNEEWNRLGLCCSDMSVRSIAFNPSVNTAEVDRGDELLKRPSMCALRFRLRSLIEPGLLNDLRKYTNANMRHYIALCFRCCQSTRELICVPCKFEIWRLEKFLIVHVELTQQSVILYFSACSYNHEPLKDWNLLVYLTSIMISLSMQSNISPFPISRVCLFWFFLVTVLKGAGRSLRSDSMRVRRPCHQTHWNPEELVIKLTESGSEREVMVWASGSLCPPWLREYSCRWSSRHMCGTTWTSPLAGGSALRSGTDWCRTGESHWPPWRSECSDSLHSSPKHHQTIVINWQFRVILLCTINII